MIKVQNKKNRHIVMQEYPLCICGMALLFALASISSPLFLEIWSIKGVVIGLVVPSIVIGILKYHRLEIRLLDNRVDYVEKGLLSTKRKSFELDQISGFEIVQGKGQRLHSGSVVMNIGDARIKVIEADICFGHRKRVQKFIQQSYDWF